jgi:hypothetical protein
MMPVLLDDPDQENDADDGETLRSMPTAISSSNAPEEWTGS